MSRSRKKHAITGFTTARSEKQDKRIMNRAIRRITRNKLKQDDREDAILPIPDEVMNVWSMAKDGKHHYDKVDKPDCANCLDKIKCLTDETYKEHNCRSWCRYQWYLKSMRK